MYVADGGTCVITFWRMRCPAQYHEYHCRDCRLTDNDDLFLLAFSACHLEERGKSEPYMRACVQEFVKMMERIQSAHTQRNKKEKERVNVFSLFFFIRVSRVLFVVVHYPISILHYNIINAKCDSIFQVKL
jgi:hypothetical protein